MESGGFKRAWERETDDGRGPSVVHCCKTIFVAKADAFPDSVFGRDKVGETFTDNGESGERGNIGDGGLEKDLN